MRSMLTLVVFLTLSAPALASDGVLEINQTCAVQTGCFAGDDPGFPVTVRLSLGSPSLQLKSDLVLPAPPPHGIELFASGVSINLAGFSIRGAACVGTNANCSPPLGPSANGVYARAGVSGVTVENGSIVGMGSYGLSLGPRATVRNVRVAWNNMGGVDVRDNSVVSGITAFENGNSGISMIGSGLIAGNSLAGNQVDGIIVIGTATITDNMIVGNGGNGILCDDACVVSGNVATGNQRVGIRARNGLHASRNALRSNGLSGILAGQAAVIEGNTVSANGASGIETGYLAHVVENSLDGNSGIAIDADDGSNVSRNTVGPITPSFASFPGIVCGAGCAVYDNAVRNTSQAMSLGSGSRYGRNVLTLTPNPAVTGSGFSAGDNLCNGSSC